MRIIMNPPYQRNLHLKVLSKAMERCPDAEIVNLSPIRWLTDTMAEYKRNSDWRKFEHIRKHIDTVDEYTAVEMLNVFDAQFAMSLGIYHITKDGKGVDLRNKIVMKMLKKHAYYDELDAGKKDGWRVRTVIICGADKFGNNARKTRIGKVQKLLIFKDGMKDGKPWYEHFTKTSSSKTTPEITHSIRFNTEQEAQNFIDAMHTKVGTYYYCILHNNLNVKPYYFLKLDWTKKWDDAALCEYFGITDEEFATIERELEE